MFKSFTFFSSTVAAPSGVQEGGVWKGGNARVAYNLPPHIYCCYLCYPHHRHYHQYDHCDTYQLIKQRPGPTCNHGLVNRFTGKRRDESYSAFCLQINSLLRSLIEVQEDIRLETLTSMKLIYFQNIKNNPNETDGQKNLNRKIWNKQN